MYHLHLGKILHSFGNLNVHIHQLLSDYLHLQICYVVGTVLQSQSFDLCTKLIHLLHCFPYCPYKTVPLIVLYLQVVEFCWVYGAVLELYGLEKNTHLLCLVC